MNLTRDNAGVGMHCMSNERRPGHGLLFLIVGRMAELQQVPVTVQGSRRLEVHIVRTFLVAGSPDGRPPAGLRPGPGDRVIAADRGGAHALRWGWPVHLLIGDLDSLPTAELALAEAAGVPVVVAPSAKDETDLELGLAYALRDGAREIVICGALGARTDHMLANLFLLARDELTGLDIAISEGTQTIRLLRGGSEARQHPEEASCLMSTGVPGDLLSLLPVGGNAVGVTTEGLLYPLSDETLFFGQARGVSNVFLTATVRVWLRAGLLFAIHTRNRTGGTELVDE
jgi:thiamine pyrophosphokinase